MQKSLKTKECQISNYSSTNFIENKPTITLYTVNSIHTKDFIYNDYQDAAEDLAYCKKKYLK